MKNIKIKFNFLTIIFFLVMALSGYLYYSLIIVFIVFFHEIGHVFFARLFGFKVVEIELFPFGGNTKIDKKLNNNIFVDILISLGGVIFQFFIFILCKQGVIKSSVINYYNVSIMLFNLLPVIPLDGSKIIFDLLNLIFSYKKSLNIEIIISIIFTIIYTLANYIYSLDNYLIIVLFLIKTVELYKNRLIIFNKFILERMIYNLKFRKIKNFNEKINNYQKDVKYYYKINNNLIPEDKYLKMIYK